jgi:hypothetical protein
MAHQLSFISPANIIQAMDTIDADGIPEDHQWNEFWIFYRNNPYPFKYTTKLAASAAGTPKRTVDFQSNSSNRRAISNLGFNIRFLNPNQSLVKPRFWVAASYYGPPGDQKDMLAEFIEKGYWATDHDPGSKEGEKIFQKLKSVSVYDRIGIRYLSRKKNTIEIVAIGTVKNTDQIGTGRFDVVWDLKPLTYKGDKPNEKDAGDWWKTIIEIVRPDDIELLFGFAKTFNRAARLAWNSNGWIMPSGTPGKSTNPKSHEKQYGYGHEEWIFDTGKLIGNYHYGFLEPIRKHQQAYTGKHFNIWLYTINGANKLRYWVGNIEQVEVIDEHHAEQITDHYRKEGWLEEMRNQIIQSGANTEGFSNYKGIDLFNIRFKPENVTLNDPYYELHDSHDIYKTQRYTLLFQKSEYLIRSPEIEGEFTFVNPGSLEDDLEPKTPKKGTKIPAPRPVEMVYLHDAICRGLTKKLKTIYGKSNVRREHPAGYGQFRIDIVVKDDDDLIFYEVKSYTSLITSIREAMGQLMEYAYWPDKQRAKKLVIVTQTPLTPSASKYIKHIRDTCGLPLYYQSYDHLSEKLSMEV